MGCARGLIVALVAALPGIAAPPRAEEGAVARVSAASIDVFERPSENAFTTGRLARGRRVVVHHEEGDGWLAIMPPPGSFSLVDERALDELDDGRASIAADRTPVRAGIPGARLPGPAGRTLARGTIVRLVDREPLTLRHGPTTRVYRAIEPPRGEWRYVRAEGIDREPVRLSSLESDRPPAPRIPVDPSLAAPGPAEPAANLPAGFAASLARIEGAHRMAIRRSIDDWRLDGIRRDYETLARQYGEPAAQAIVRRRLDQVRRQETLAKSARKFDTLVARSRARDTAAAGSPGGPSALDEPPFDAEGMLQVSSKLVEGQRVYALIGASGMTSAYLRIPPGLEVQKLLTHQVGVRGTLRYDDRLRATLIDVSDLEPTSSAP